MTAVVPNADELIEARRAAGRDRFDEVIKGVYFMVPPSSAAHGRHQAKLAALLLSHGVIVATEGGVGFPGDYLIPDLVVYATEPDDDTLYADPATVHFVVEIRSDGNAGPHWDAKLSRLTDWQIPVVIFDGDEIINRDELTPEIQAYFD